MITHPLEQRRCSILKALKGSRGMAFPYVILFLFLTMIPLAIWTSSVINYTTLHAKSKENSAEVSALNEVEGIIKNSPYKPLTGKLVKTVQTKNDVYTAELTPTGVVTTEARDIEYLIDRNADTIKKISVSSSTDLNSLIIENDTLTGEVKKYLVSSNNTSEGVLYDTSSKKVTLAKDPRISKLAYRVNNSELFWKADYPASDELTLQAKYGDLINLYYYSEDNQLVLWRRFTLSNMSDIDNSRKEVYLVRLPSKDSYIDSELGNLDKFDYVKMTTKLTYDSNTNQKEVDSDLQYNFVTNSTGNVGLGFEVSSTNQNTPIQTSYDYKEGGSTTFNLDDSYDSDETTINITHDISANTALLDLDSIHINDTEDKLMVGPRTATMTLGNAIVNAVKVSKTEVVSAEYDLTIRDKEGTILRRKKIVYNTL